jgi:hypothetical protein
MDSTFNPLVVWPRLSAGATMKTQISGLASPLRRQAADTFLRARKLPVGRHRNDLRQLAFGLLRLHKLSLSANVYSPDAAIKDFQSQQE